MNDWASNIDDGYFIGACSLDIKKCFDTINHRTLIKKLNFYGFSDNTIKWFKSYLTDRGHKVKCNSLYSDVKYTNIGVPQGSI